MSRVIELIVTPKGETTVQTKGYRRAAKPQRLRKKAHRNLTRTKRLLLTCPPGRFFVI